LNPRIVRKTIPNIAINQLVTSSELIEEQQTFAQNAGTLQQRREGGTIDATAAAAEISLHCIGDR
jgi:hypothetical protein